MDSLLELLEYYAAKVRTGETVGRVVLAGNDDGTVPSGVQGRNLPPCGVLVAQDIEREATEIFLDHNNRRDDRRPPLQAVGSDESQPPEPEKETERSEG